MTKEYRFKGVSPEGKLVQGTFMADSAKAAKQQLAKVELRYKLRIQSFEKKRDWLYKVFVAGKNPRAGASRHIPKRKLPMLCARWATPISRYLRCYLIYLPSPHCRIS
jgi:type II secretory pathway component PulF